MRDLLIIANFKSHLTYSEAKDWLKTFSKVENKQSLRSGDLRKVILCPSFIHLQLFSDYKKGHNLTVELGAQNISRLPEGAHTGEVNGAQIKDFANYVIVGHSERRGAFGEDESVIEEKIKMSLEYGLIPILCVQSENFSIPTEVSIVAYEPTFAIGTGNPDTPDNAQNVAKKIKEKANVEYILYGGSVTPENVNHFTSMENINGVLVGTDSLDPLKFLQIVDNA